jgi:hypothetical protein
MKTQPVEAEHIDELAADRGGGLSCLRCAAKLTDYRPTRFTFLPYGISRAHAMVVCPKCGHVEFLSKDSPLLGDLEAIASDVGDGD